MACLQSFRVRKKAPETWQVACDAWGIVCLGVIAWTKTHPRKHSNSKTQKVHKYCWARFHSRIIVCADKSAFEIILAGASPIASKADTSTCNVLGSVSLLQVQSPFHPWCENQAGIIETDQNGWFALPGVFSDAYSVLVCCNLQIS